MTDPKATSSGPPADAGTSGDSPLLTPGQEPRLVVSGVAALAVLATLAFLHFAASVFITLLSSLLLAFALEPAVHFLCVRTRLRRQFASGIVVFLFIAVLYGIFYVAYLRVGNFLADLPEIVDRIRSAPLVESLSAKAGRLSDLLVEAGRRIASSSPGTREGAIAPPLLVRDTASVTRNLVEGLGSLTSVVFSLSFIPFLVYFLLADREPLTRRTRELFPREHRETVGQILLDIERMLRKFLLGNAMIASILSAATVLVFLIVKLPHPIVLGVLSGITSIIPYLGLPLALLPGLIVGIVSFETPLPFIMLVASVTALHLIGVNYLTPRIVGKEVHLNATASTTALLFFAWLWGGMGLLLAIPILSVVKCILENIPPTRRIGLWLGD
ncbi:MAG: AI-2E family transporter [Verrucomicrobiota bacterium]